MNLDNVDIHQSLFIKNMFLSSLILDSICNHTNWDLSQTEGNKNCSFVQLVSMSSSAQQLLALLASHQSYLNNQESFLYPNSKPILEPYVASWTYSYIFPQKSHWNWPSQISWMHSCMANGFDGKNWGILSILIGNLQKKLNTSRWHHLPSVLTLLD